MKVVMDGSGSTLLRLLRSWSLLLVLLVWGCVASRGMGESKGEASQCGSFSARRLQFRALTSIPMLAMQSPLKGAMALANRLSQR